MKKNIIFFLVGFFAVIGFGVIILLNPSPSEPKIANSQAELSGKPLIKPKDKVINEPVLKDKSNKLAETVQDAPLPVITKEVPAKEKEVQVIKVEKEIEVKAIAKEVIETKVVLEKKKSKYSFSLEFKGLDEKALPDEADIVLHSNKNEYMQAKILPIKRIKAEKFILNLDNKENLCFDIRVKGFGYAKEINIPFDTSTQITIDLQKGSQIKGVVTDRLGKAIKGVAFEILKEQESGFGVSMFITVTSKVYSDEQGNYLLSEITPGRYKVKLSHAKYLSLEKWVIFSLDVDQVVNFQMEEGSQIEGTVEDQNGVFLKDILVVLKQAKAQDLFNIDFRNDESKSAITDTNGQFALMGLKTGPYVISVEAKGIGHLKNYKVEIKADELKKSIKLVLKTSFKIKGKVVDLAGKAIENVILEIPDEKGSFGMSKGSVNTANSDINGAFELNFLDDKSYKIIVNSEAYRIANNEPLSANAGVEDLIVTVKEMMAIKGSVLLPSGQQAIGYELSVRYEKFGFNAPASDVKISENGFTFNPKIMQMGGDTNKIFVCAKLKGYDEGVSKLLEFKNDVDLINDVVIQLKEASVTKLKITTYDRKVISEIDFIATPTASRMSSHDTIEKKKLEENNILPIFGLKDVEYDMLFKLEGYANTIVKFKSKDNIEVQEIVLIKGGVVKGVVYDVNSQPMAFQKMNLKRIDLLSISLLPYLSYNIYTNEKGEFQFDRIPVGEYRLKKVNADKGFSPMDVFNVAEGESVKVGLDQEVTINIGSKEEVFLQISGQIFVDDKIYEKSISIYLTGSSTTNSTITKMITSEQEGKFSANQLLPGKYNLMIGLEGVGKEEMERYPIEVVQGKENNFSINLYSEKISGTINSIDGEKLSGSISVFPGGFLSSQLNSFETFTKSLYTTSFKNGEFSMKLPKEAVDIYFTFNNKKYSATYIQNASKQELLKKNWTITVPANITRVFKVSDESGKKISNYDLLVIDEKGVTLLSDLRGMDGIADTNKEEIYLPSDKDSVLYISCAEFSTMKKVVLKSSIDPINIVLKTGFEITVIANGRENDLVELFDENKKPLIQPISKTNLIMTHLGGSNSNSIKEGKKIFKNISPNKYLVKISDSKDGNIKWSEVFEVLGKSVEIELK